LDNQIQYTDNRLKSFVYTMHFVFVLVV